MSIIEMLSSIELRSDIGVISEPEFQEKLFAFTIQTENNESTQEEKTVYGLPVYTHDVGDGQSELFVVARVGDQIRPFVLTKQREVLTHVYDLNFCIEDECSFLLENGHILYINPEELELKLLEAVSK